MNLALFFDPVPEEVFAVNPHPASWQPNIRIFRETFPSLKEMDIAILGVTDERGTTTNIGVWKAANAIRKTLYGLKKGNGAYRICDLGNLRSGESLEDTWQRTAEVCETLMQHNIIPVILGSSQDITLGQFMAYEHLDKPITLLNIDPALDIYPENGESEGYLNRIFTSEKTCLFQYCHLGYQSFLVEKEKMQTLEKLYFEFYRLGQIRENIQECEPLIRTADMISFDISAIRMSDAPGNHRAQPFGLSGEEACQLCWYAGINSRMSSIGFYEFNPDADNRVQTATTIAVMIWYFTEGYYHRLEEINLNDPRFVRYIVSLKQEPHHLTFYKDTLTEKWWMEVPFREGKSRYSRNALVPCSYKDYQDAGNGDIPNRWILTHSKLS